MKENSKETNSETGPRDSAFETPTDVFPVVTVVAASAGAGKTYVLTHRYVQILLSRKIRRNSLQNVLAITFTNNAAAEMKQRILTLLKLTSLGDEKTIRELEGIVSQDAAELRVNATRLIDEIFDNYSDFQVKTIDSFMAAVFKSSSLEYGYHPDFEILLDSNNIFDYAFELFSREVKENSPQAFVLEKLIELISENRKADSNFLWDPYKNIAAEVKRIYTLIVSQTKPLNTTDGTAEMSFLRTDIKSQAAKVELLIKKSSLSTNHNFAADLQLIHAGDMHALMGRKLRTSPVNKPKGKAEAAAYEKWIEDVEAEHTKLNGLLREYILCYAKTYFVPYIDAYGMLQTTIGRVKRQFGQIFIDDVNKTLAEHIDAEAVPEIYFKIGETIYHYLIDEFQDTSQLQWKNLRPLIEESLSKEGSLFVVGDTKQSIYGFRDADWRIMRRLTETAVFPSAFHEVKKLEMNYRSCEKIVDFNKKIFHEIIPAEDYAEEAAASGLSTFEQKVKPEHQGKGYVEVALFPEDEDVTPEKAKVIEIVQECHSRGYRYDEIAILTPNNTNVIEASGWLNENGIPFISHSTLDVRRRKSAGEFIALLRFLDSPVDDLSFSVFVLGDIFGRLCQRNNHPVSHDHIARFIFEERTQRGRPLYAAFREHFKSLWDEYFEHLFNVVGYLPLYDLLSESYKIFDVFRTSPTEEAALVKLLEVVKTFEREGSNTVKDFLEFSGDESNNEVWKIDVPKNIDALQVMTVHKAKGIEFPVVIVILHDQPVRGSGTILDEDENSVWLLKVNKQMGENVDILGAMLEREKFKDTVDALNKLYVAFTRAEKEMYVVGVYKKERKEPTRFLPESGYEPSAKPAVHAAAIESENVFEPFHHTARRALGVQTYESFGMQETKRGDFVHRIFSYIDYAAADLNAQIDAVLVRVQGEMRFELSLDKMKSTVVEFLSHASVHDYFVHKEGRTVLREQELANRHGALYRADRVIIDAARVTVMDFKTGSDENENDYIQQVSNYMAMLKEIYPEKKIDGVIAYVDLKKTRSIA
jgi:ATP-dependent exoDNAse (exonuclease V) beta subunit